MLTIVRKQYTSKFAFRAWALGLLGACFAASLFAFPVPASAGNWNVAVGVAGGNGYRPIAYGSGYGVPYGPGFGRGYWNGGPYGYGGWGSGWNTGWGTGWGYPYVFNQPPAVFIQAVPVEPIVLAAQSQPPVWYFCASTLQYFPNVGPVLKAGRFSQQCHHPRRKANKNLPMPHVLISSHPYRFI